MGQASPVLSTWRTIPRGWDWGCGSGLLDFASSVLDGLAENAITNVNPEPAWTDFCLERLGQVFCSSNELLVSAGLKDSAALGGDAEPGVGDSRLRLRRRGRLTNVLESLAARSPGWWSDLTGGAATGTPAAWLYSYLESTGVKVGSGILKEISCGGDNPSLHAVSIPFRSDEGSRLLWVCPELVAALAAVRIFRPLTEALVASLRSRSRLWAEERGLNVMDLVSVMPGSLALACLPMPDEVVALGSLRGAAGRWSVDVLGAFAKGTLKSPSGGGQWWRVLKPLLRFGGPREGVLDGRGAGPITIPT